MGIYTVGGDEKTKPIKANSKHALSAVEWANRQVLAHAKPTPGLWYSSVELTHSKSKNGEVAFCPENMSKTGVFGLSEVF